MRGLVVLSTPIKIGLVMIGAAICWIGLQVNSTETVALGNGLLTLVGILHLFLALAYRESHWSLCDVLAASVFISYFGGAAVTLFLAATQILTFANLQGLTFLFETTVFIVIFCVFLLLCGALERFFWRPVWAREAEAETWSVWAAVSIGGLSVLQAYCLATGIVSYQGTGSIGDGVQIPYFGNLVIALSLPLAGVCGWVCGRAELRENRFLIMTVLGAVPVQFLFNLCFGRRMILYQTLAFLIAFIWARGRGFTMKQTIVIGMLALPLILASWYVFLAMRMDRYSDLAGERRDIFSRLQTSSELLGDRFDVVQRQQEDNVVTRVFVIGYLSELLASNGPSPFLNGREFVFQLVTSIPRVLLPDKQGLINSLQAGESHINRNFGLPDRDRAGSMLVASYADFGWLGVVLGPIIVEIMGIMFAGLARLGHSPLLRMYVVAYTLHNGLTVEQSYVIYTTNALRIVAVVAGVFLVAEVLYRGRRFVVPARTR